MTNLPDITSLMDAQVQGTLDRVGMSGISLPITIADSQIGSQAVNAKVSTYVNLSNPLAKGIHMSRLYLALNETAMREPVSIQSLAHHLTLILNGHNGLSDKAFLTLEFELPLNRKALLSNNRGWKSYQVIISVEVTGRQSVCDLTVEVVYSSTCPCSASLARQLLQGRFADDFSERESISTAEVEKWLLSEKGSYATPHSQRSRASVTVRLANRVELFPIVQLINRVEDVLQTPVQTAVKREDEQEFAKRNGSNLMFCEDAARRIKRGLDSEIDYRDFKVQVEHFESLHAHDAVAMVTKGVPGGFDFQ